MADVKISQLTSASALDGTEAVPVVQASATRRTTLALIRDYVRAGLTLAWGSITGTPTTLAGYGITDAASDAELSAHEADTTNVHGIADTSALVLTGDSRLSNARTPTTHASTHASAGSDPIAPADIGAAAASHTHADASTSVAGFMSAADKTKLNGIANGATANATDAQLRDRSTHTGTQAISTVSGLQTALDAKLNTPSHQALIDAANIAWNVANGPMASVTLGGNRTLDLPTNIAPGGTYLLRVVQDATGGRTLSYAAGITWLTGSPTLSSGANKTTLLSFACFSSGALVGVSAVAEP